MTAGAWVCLLAPLAGCLVITLSGPWISRRTAGWISTLTTFVAFAGAADAFIRTWANDPEERSHLSTAYTWLAAGKLEVGLQILVDPLSLVMMLVVSGVGGLIVWYSMGYMAGDDEERRFFAYMSLFIFSMLLLVEAGNFLVMLVGWGLVGLASYLLIGFWHQRPEAVAAAKKAFVMNAFGDATFALGIVLLFWNTGSFEFGTVFANVGGLSSTTVNLVALGLLGGAVAKSAQLPIHTWLPDAMEGPTPVSALIHAATMVTAGVYLLVRAHPVFEAAPDIQQLAAILGAITLLVAGLIALVQWDIKKVIAYSTMSQIGYMFIAAGIGAYGFAIFHLATHAFFKALLFLSAGVVIHHLDGEQDIRKMGGLRGSMPRTHVAFLVGTLALVGIPPFAGFFSKDAILASAFALGGTLGWITLAAGLVGTFLTGLYAFRLYYRVWRGPSSDFAEEHAHSHGHGEGPLSMLAPVGVLTALAAIGGFLHVSGLWDANGEWLNDAVEGLVEPSTAQDYEASFVAVLLGSLGMYLAWTRARHGKELVTRPDARRVLEHKLYFDELYDAIFYRPAAALARGAFRHVETPLIERPLDELGSAALDAGGGVARVQTGLVRTYALAVALAVAVLVVVFVAVR